MINFKELIKERDEMQVKIDDVRLRIKKFTDVKEEVPDWLWEEESTYKSYQESIINRIGCELTEEDVAEYKKVVLNLDAEDSNDDEDTEATPFGFIKLIKEVSDKEVEKLKQETSLMFGELTPLSPFNPAGVEVSEESDKVDEDQCGCKDCTSEEDDNTENMSDTIINAFLLMGLMDAINAIESKKEGK